MTDLAERAKAIIDGNSYLTLGTADAAGEPWASPVFYVPDGYSTFYWISSPEATQVRNIAVRPRVGIVVFDSRQEPGTGDAVYMAATAGELTGADLDRGLEIYLGAAPFGGGPEDFRTPGPYRAYRATVTEHSMLCPRSSREPCPIHGRVSDHRTVVTL
jgi:pyridoxamine 5'-phosphate oxidase-like protein